MSVLYQRYYVYNPVGGFDVTIDTAVDGHSATLTAQAIDLGGENIELPIAFTLVTCDVDGVRDTVTFVSATEAEGQILIDYSGSKNDTILCTTNDEGLFECDFAYVGLKDVYWIITSPMGTVDIVGPAEFLG